MRDLVIVTGGTKGIGRSILYKFAQEKFDLVTCSRSSIDLSEIESEIHTAFPHVNVHTKKADLSKKKDALAFIDFVHKLKGAPKVLVNNAGLFIPGKISEEPDGALKKMIETNLYSAYYITRGFVDQMKKQRDGHIFTIGSTASIMPYIDGGSYCISKFALLGMSKVLREELKEYNVRVTSVLPGATYTASWEGTELPQDRFMKAEDIAEAVYSCWKLSSSTVVEEILLRPQLGDI